MRIFYCYSLPLKNFLKNRGVHPICEGFKINTNSNKHYWEYKKGKILDESLSVWKENKVKAIEYIKSK